MEKIEIEVDDLKKLITYAGSYAQQMEITAMINGEGEDLADEIQQFLREMIELVGDR